MIFSSITGDQSRAYVSRIRPSSSDRVLQVGRAAAQRLVGSMSADRAAGTSAQLGHRRRQHLVRRIERHRIRGDPIEPGEIRQRGVGDSELATRIGRHQPDLGRPQRIAVVVGVTAEELQHLRPGDQVRQVVGQIGQVVDPQRLADLRLAPPDLGGQRR